MITQERIKKLLSYDPDYGVFTRLTSAGGFVKGTKAGSNHNAGYLRIGIDGREYLCHRLAWLYVTGELPKQIDHINHIRTDNRWCNLRSVDSQENHKNTSIRKDNKSGAIGVHWNKEKKRWGSQININKKTVHIGYFADKFEAICARKSEEFKCGFHENHGRN